MLCDHCKKNEATIHIKEIHDGKCVSLNLCAQCAASKEEKGELGAFGLNLADALFHIGAITQKLQQNPPSSGKSSSPAGDAAGEAAGDAGPACPVCGWTLAKIRSANGKLGCPECYRTFADMIRNAVDHCQKGPEHLGKRPVSSPDHAEGARRAELERLRRELQNCVRKEDYEQAAVCRDRIKELQSILADK